MCRDINTATCSANAKLTLQQYTVLILQTREDVLQRTHAEVPTKPEPVFKLEEKVRTIQKTTS